MIMIYDVQDPLNQFAEDFWNFLLGIIHQPNQPNLDNCIGCHVVIEENREAFHRDHKVSPPLAEMRSDSNWAELADLLKKGRTDKTTMVTYTIKV